MIVIPNYQILAQIYESANSLVYRGVRNEDNQPVIFKILKEDYPTPEELTRYRQEYELIRRLNQDGIIKVYSLEKYQNRLVMCLEDFGGESLRHHLAERTFSMEEQLWFAIRVTDILGQIHQNHIIHKDINPANIIWNLTTGQVKIIDFGISTQLSRENPTLKNPNVLEGTLAYMSPEQTGRMNRALDYRTDFYSLGVTLYELFTGQLPFQTQDMMELVHCHIAKPPSPPHHLPFQEITPEEDRDTIENQIPVAVSNIIMKLLEKTAEARYQSAWGIKADLENCLNQLKSVGKVESFPLASSDLSDKFQIPQKLYGRERQVETLLDAFEQVSQGHTQLMLVTGYSGIGKSMLIKEIYQSLTAKHGYFISGKFDQFQRNIPYNALVSAFGELVQQLLTESETQFLQWKNKLLDAIGSNGQVIIDVIPEMERIVGPQPTVPTLGALESQNRFHLVFQNVLRVFCQPSHPLVLFLDDLQWADSATLKLLERVMTDKGTHHLFLIGAYRDNEVTPTHALMMTLEKLQQEATIINQIHLTNLNVEQVNQLIADSLHTNFQVVQSLTELVLRKTEGNPFFVNQFLKTLYEEHLLHFTPPNGEAKGEWQWDMSQIEAMDITDNVVDLMIGKLKKLPPASQHVLRLAACMGNRFDLNTLSVINEKATAYTFQELMPVLTEGLVLPTSALEITEDDILQSQLSIVNFQFLHDRVQQAAYALIDENQKKPIHLQIGRLLLKNTSSDELGSHLFDIIEQLNHGIELLDSQTEKNEIAQFNLMAGQKAKTATAYEASLKYLQIGRKLLVEDSWNTQYNLTFSIYVETMEAAYLHGDFEQTTMLSEVILPRAKTVLDKAKVYETEIQSYVAQNQMQMAIEVGLQTLKMMGISLSQSLPEFTIENLSHLPEMTDPHKLTAMRILMAIEPSAFVHDPVLLSHIIFTMISISINHGNAPQSAFAYNMHGCSLCWSLKDLEMGYQFGKVALKILEHLGTKARETKSQVNQGFNFAIQHCKEPIPKTVESFPESLQICLENGDIEWASYAALSYCCTLCFVGKPLDYVSQKQDLFISLLQGFKRELSLFIAKIWGQMVLNLSGKTQEKQSLTGELFDEAQMLPLWIKSGNLVSLFHAYTAKTMLSYFFQDSLSAIGFASQATRYEQATLGSLSIVYSNFYYSLALLAQYPTVAKITQIEYLETVATNQQKMAIWAKHAPMNFQNKYDLVEAEKARVLEQLFEAEMFYEKAIEGAMSHGYVQEEALAYELAAEFYLARGMKKFAQIYLKEGHYAYQRWGAMAKVKDLEERYPQFLTQKTSTQVPSILTTTTTNMTMGSSSPTQTVPSTFLDLNSVIKASQTLSGEIVLSRLLEKMMRIVIENAGAEKGLLLLPVQDNWFIEAEGYVNKEKINVLQSIALEEHPGLATTIVHYVARTQNNVVLNNAATEESQFIRDPYIVKYTPKSVLCAPLVNQGQLAGILYLENNLTTEAFTSERLETLKVLSSQVAISIENALLYQNLEQKVEERTRQLADANEEITALNQQLKSDNLRMSAELDISRQLQQMLLPTEKELTKIADLDIVGFMEPADEVGGDYYDVLQDKQSILFGIGDVTGHGLESGALAIMVQTAVRTLQLVQETDPVKFLNTINQLIYYNVQRMNSDKSLTFALLSYQDGVIHLSGQHEEMIVVRNGHLERIDTMDLGFPIGLEEDIADFIAETQLQLKPGDVVVLYTDGITEAENVEGNFYNIERLCQVIQQNWQQSAEKIRQTVIDDVRQFIGEQKVFDDITLLVLKQK